MIVLIIIAIILVFGILYYLFPPIQVVGDSMYPTYRDGEIVFGRRIFNKSKLKIDDVIIYKTPTDNKIVIKRIHNIKRGKRYLHFYCLGDNLDFSYDSRDYGFISSRKLVCKVINQRRNKNVCN